MATEADVPEQIMSSTQRVDEDICLASGLSEKAVHETPPGELIKFQGTLELPLETGKCQAEQENMQAAHNIGAETMNSVIKGNVETPEGQRFLESPSAAALANEETCTTSKHCQADEESFQDKKKMSENKRQMKNDATNGISEETGSGEKTVVEDSEEKAETNERNCDIVHLTGTSSQVAKLEELNLGITEEGSLEKENYVDQHIEVVEDQQDSAEHKSINKETGDMQKNKQDADTSLELNTQFSNTTGVTLDQNKEASIHRPDPRVGLNKDIEIAAEPCNEAETIKAKFTGEEIGKTISAVDDKEAEKSTNLVGKEESSEATRLSEGVDNKQDEKEKSMNYSTGDILESRLATYPDIQSEEESMSKVRDINKELLHKSSVTPAEDECSVHEAGPETDEKLKEVSSISCEENNNNMESSEKMEQTVPVEDEMNHRNNIDTPFAMKTEETSLQPLENPELLKVVSRSWSDDIIKESPNEVTEKIEKTAEGDSTSHENCKDNENPEQEGEGSFMKHEGTSSIIEVQGATEVSSGENRDDGGSTIVVTKDNTDDTKITEGLEHNHSGKSNCEERPDNLQQNEPEIEKLDPSLSTVAQDFSTAASNKNFETTICDDKDESCEESIVETIIDASQQSQSGTSNNEERPEKLQQNEPEKENLDGSLTLANVDLQTVASTEYVETIPCAQKEAPIKSREDSFADKIEEDIRTHSGPIIETEIPEDKNVLATEMIDDSEVHVPNKDANGLQATCPLTEAAIQIESKELDIISDFEPKGQTHEAYKASTEQKHIEDAPDASQNSNCTISEHKSTERETAEPISTSGTDMTKLQEACGLDSEENSMINDFSESKDQEMKTNEEACHTVTHEIVPKGDDAGFGKDINNAEASVEDNRAISVTDEVVEQKFHIESSLAAPTLCGEDETYKLEDNAEMNNTTNQQVHDGTNIVGSGEAANEQVTESSVASNSQESAEKETVESPQLITKEVEKSEGENNSEGIIEDDNTGGLLPVLAEQDPIKNLNNERKKAEESIGEVNWTVDQAATEASPEEKRNEDINSYHNELVKANDNIGKKPSESEEDLRYMLQKKKSGEKLEESLPIVSNDTQIVSSSADKIPCLIKEGAPPNLEDTAQKEERVNEAEENNDTKDNKIAMEEDLKLVAKTSKSSTESTVLEPKSKRDIMVVEDVTKKGESEQDLKLVKTSEASMESIVLEPKSESDIMVVEDDTKKGESEQDFKLVAKTTEASTESIVLEPKSERDIMVAEDDTKKGESEQDLKLVAETSEASTESIVLEPKLEGDILVVEDDTKKGESEQDLKLAVKTSEASTESIVLEPKSERDIMVVEEDTKKGESGQDLKLVEETSKVSTESIDFEPKSERDIMAVEDVTKKGEFEQDLKSVTKTSEANTECIVLEPKSERDIMSADTKGESEELYKDSKTDGKDGHTEKQNTIEECITMHMLPEVVREKAPNSFKEDQNEEDRPKTEVHAEPDLTSTSEDAGRQLIEEENTVEQCKELEVKKTVQSSEEDDTTIKMPKQDSDIYISVESIEQETFESSQGNINKAEMPEDENRREQIIEEGLIPESIEKSPTQNLNDEKQKTQNSTGEILDNSGTAKAFEGIAHETSKTTESPEETLNTSLEKSQKSTRETLENFEIVKATESTTHETSKTTESLKEILDTSLQKTQKSTEENFEIVKAIESISLETSKTTESLEEILDTSLEKTQKSIGEILQNFETIETVESIAHKTSKTTENLEEILDTSPEKTQKSIEEISKNSKTTEAAESIAHETSKTTKSPKEILDTSSETTQQSTREILENFETVKAVKSIAHETSKTTESIEEILDTSPEKTQKSTGEILKNLETVETVESIAHETSKAIESSEKILDTSPKNMQKSIGEILENSETAKTVESIAHKTSRTIESSEEILDTSQEKTQTSTKKILENFDTIKAVESSTHETSKTIESLKEIPDTFLEKTQMSTGEILENSETTRTVESIAHETNKITESPKEILHTSPVKQEENFLEKEKKTEASSEEKNEDLPPVMVAEENNSTTNELFDAKEDTPKKSLKIEADLEHILQKQEPGASEHLEQMAKTEEKTKENNEARHDKVATEEELEVVSKTSDASKSIESIVLELNLERDKTVIDDNTRKGESEEVHVELETTSTRKDAEKQIMIEENIVEQGRVLKVEKLVQTSEQDDKIANMSKRGAESIEQETVESSKCITNKAEDLEAENNEENAINSNIKDLIPESIGQDPVENLNDGKMKANKSSGEIFEISKTAGAAENIAHETTDTLAIVDTSLEKKRDDLQNEGDNPVPIEASPEEKDEDKSPVMMTQENTSVNELLDAKESIEKNSSKTEEDLEHVSQKNELGEKLDQSLSKEEDETEASSSNADKIPQQMEEGASQNEEIEQNNDVNKVAAEEDLKVVAETPDASRNKESIALETKSENEKMVDEDDLKNREYEEMSKDTKDASTGEGNEKQSIVETCHNASILPEPVEEKAPGSFAEEEKEEETHKIEIFENSKAKRAAESVAQETSEMIESPKELHDTSPVKQEENLHSEVKTIDASLEEEKNEDISPVMMVDENSNANELVNVKVGTDKKSSKSEEDLAHILQKNEAGENLEQSLSMTPLNSNADKTPCLMVEGAPQNLEETAQIEDKTEENHEEDLKVVVKTPEASKSIESTILEHDSKLDKLVVEDDMKKAESEEVHVEPDSTAMGEDAEKHITKEENTIEQCRVLETENIEQNSEEDDKIAKMSKQGNVTYIYVESVEQETVENSQGNANTAENSEAEYNNEYTMEDGNIRGLIPEPVEQDPVKNLNDEKTEAEKPSGEILEISKTAEAVESIAHEPIETVNIIDSSDKRDNLQSERDNLTPIEASPEETDEDISPVIVAQDNSSTNALLDAKDNIEKDSSKTEEDVEHISKKNETEEKVDQFLSKTQDKTEALSSNADKIPQLKEEGASQNEEAARSDGETEQSDKTKDNKIEVEEELKVVAETSDASKSKESIALEPKSEMDKTVNGDEIKNEVSEELSEDSTDTVKGEDTKEHNIVEACNALPEHIGEQPFQSSAKEETEEETPRIKGHEITQTMNKSEDTGRQNIKEGGVAERNIEVLVREIDEEESLRDENKDKEHAEEVDASSLAFIENVEATSSDKETVPETLKDRAEPIVTSHHLDVTKASEEEKHPKEIKEELVEKSISLPQAFHQDSKEEIRSKEETSCDYSDSVSVTMVKEEAGLQETEAEDTNQVESFGLVSEEKGVVETETREIMLDGRDVKVTPEDTSNSSEMMDKDNPEVAGEDRIDKEQQNQVPHAINEDQEEVATNTTPLKETLEDELNKRSTKASAEHKHESREASETVDETPENIQAPDENKGTTFITQAMEEMLMQKHDNTNPLDVSELKSIETEKETAYEAQKHKVDDLYVHPELENENDLSILEDVKILKREEIGGLTDQTLQDAESSDLILKIKETKDGKPFDEALKSTESSSVHPTVESAIIEQEEISTGNFHEGVKVEKAAIEQKEEAYSQGHDDTGTKDDGTLTEENFESVDPDQKFEFASEPVVEDQNKQIFPESEKSKIEESNKKKQQDEEEVKEEEEPTLVAEENKELNANEITKAVISTEKATGGEQLGDIEDIKEAVVEKEQGKNELHALSTVGETTNQVKNSTLVCSDAMAAKSKQMTDTDILKFEEDSIRKREVSSARQSEEQKPQDASMETLAKELEETKTEKILEESEDYCSKNDNAAIAIVTAEKSSEQAEQEDKLFKASNIGPEPCLETSETENSHQSKAIDITKLEETSCDLISNLPTVHDSHEEQESTTVENTEASECEETKMASEAFCETKDQGTEETDIGTTVEKKDQVPPLHHDHAEKEYATLENSDKNEVEEIKMASAADQITEATLEIGKSPTVERMDQVHSSNPKQEEIESTAVENLKANEFYESKVSSDANYMFQHQGTGESAGKTSTVEILDQVPISNSEHARNESVSEENPDADATKMASNVVFKSEDKDTKDNDDIRKSPTARKQDVYKIEKASKVVASDYRAHGDKSVSEDEIATDRTVSTEKLEEQLPALTSATTTAIEKVEEEKTKVVDMLEREGGPDDSSVAKPIEVTCLQKEVSRELDFSTLGLKLNKDTQECQTEVREEEGQNPDAALQLKPQENNDKIECGESSSESKNNTDLTGQTETAADLKFETSEKTIESEMVRHNHGLTESEDNEIKEKHLVAAITDMRGEAKQLKQTSEANEITQNEISKREITKEKEAAKTHRPVSLGEETMNLSLQEDELKAEECVAEKTNTININSANPIQNEELSASTASKKIEEQVATNDRNVQHPEHVSVVNKTAKETFPNEFETKDAKDAAIKLAPINQGEETNFGSGKTETLTPRDEELGTEISRKESIRESVHGSSLIQDSQESEITCVTTVKQIPTEADLIESPKAVVSTGNEYMPSGLQEGITEVRGIEPGKVHPETKGIKLEEEKIAGDSEEETVKEPVKMDIDKTSVSAILQTSSKETPQVAEHVTKEKEPIASSEEIRTEEAENIQIREGKTGEEKDEEEGDEHKKTDSSSDSPVVVDVTRDMDVKVAQKKSHGILSGVGSKVKHSISKVKKAITGKSCHHHSKPVSPK